MRKAMRQLFTRNKRGLAFELFCYMSGVVLCILLLQTLTEQALIRTMLVLPDSVQNNMRDLARQADVLIEDGDMDELADWENAQPYYLFVLDKVNKPLSHRKMHPHFEFKLKFLRQVNGNMEERVNKPVIGIPLANENTLVIQLPSELHPAHRFLNYLSASKVVIAVTIVVLFSLILARKLQQPLDRLREASRRLAQGDFKVKVVNELQSPATEFNQLAQDFDQMSRQIDSLAKKQKRLIRDVSHELRTPLARQNLALHLLKRKVTPSELELVERVEREVEEMDNLVAEILTFSQLENARYELDLKPICLETYADSQVKQSKLELRANQRLNFWPTEDSVQVLADERLVVRCLRNLIGNSIKYAGDDAVIDICFYRTWVDDMPFMALAVQDNGCGIMESQLKTIFQPFTRLESSRDKKRGGYGLGLAIVKESMQLMCGDVKARNRQGGGLHIELRFPAVAVQQ